MLDEKLLRANILGGMNSYILDVVGDDDITEVWFAYGVPDECTEDFLMELAENEKEFVDICKLFSKLIGEEK